MNEVKYIIFTVPGLQQERAIIFNGMLVHKIVAESIEKQKGVIVSAGFVTFTDPPNEDKTFVKCYGGSESLGIKECRPMQDMQVIINTLEGNCGYF